MHDVLDVHLLRKYDVPVPRYTSYPALPHWKGISEAEWIQSISDTTDKLQDISLSLYIHIPYCQSLCSFCGCTKVISKDKSKAPLLVDTLLHELELKLKNYFAPQKAVFLKELHLGGGSPTWLPAEELERLLKGVISKFANSTRDIAIEVDPRTLTLDQIRVMSSMGVNRVSIGVQDFNPLTLAAIKRNQSYEQVLWACNNLRENNIKQINFDLVYGLPYQSLDSIQETLRKVTDLKPTRIAFYSYAHLPHLKQAQKGVEKHGLPSDEQKRNLFELARKLLINHGYYAIGMDHFATYDDELYRAHKDHRLHRNFMGYTVQNTNLLLGIGPSALSDSSISYHQNNKNVLDWHSMIESDKIDPEFGHKLNPEELLFKKIIMSLMCHGYTPLTSKLVEDLENTDLIKDKLVQLNEDQTLLTITERGKPFIRNICASLDPHLSILNQSSLSPHMPKFSRSV